VPSVVRLKVCAAARTNAAGTLTVAALLRLLILCRYRVQFKAARIRMVEFIAHKNRPNA